MADENNSESRIICRAHKPDAVGRRLCDCCRIPCGHTACLLCPVGKKGGGATQWPLLGKSVSGSNRDWDEGLPLPCWSLLERMKHTPFGFLPRRLAEQVWFFILVRNFEFVTKFAHLIDSLITYMKDCF